MYTQSITRTHRTAIILAIDGSGSMAEKIRFRNRQMTKAEVVATITNGMLFELIERARTILAAEEYNPSGDSVALSNIHRRIRMLYQPGSGLYVSRSLLGGFRSEIRMIGEKKYVSDDDR